MKLWGCHNRADYLPGYMLHGTSKETGQPTSIYIPYVMATDGMDGPTVVAAGVDIKLESL